ncbi:APC family permease [Paenibacillus sacheonensis]|uniref:Amino acid permease n=1 Tax=Paenibacillus sacheonensis TaxID=742054 RepID=A0A7X4YKQ2_9BACL|nr:APC family permease [Paenibacillus sacheonensis]MBM7563271.1 putrescine importer [Paenibacillus sacheonensis]NBC68171.1 amino acid permease [Paenibacillus sacheonensis]
MREPIKLQQTLTLFQVVFLGLAWMTPMIYFSIYGIAYESSSGMLTQAYLAAFIAIMFTAYSYGLMSIAHPTSGSAYTYVKKALHPYLGFLVGWALLLDYLFSPIIACLTFGIYMHAQFPVVPAYAWMIGINVAITLANIKGASFSANLSKWFVLLQMGFIGLFCALLVRHSPAHSDPLAPLLQTDIPFSTILTGASVICFSFLGFDSITTMAEETKNAKKNIPRAIGFIIIIASILYVTPSYLTQLVFPKAIAFLNIDSAGLEIVKMVGGAALSTVFIVVLLFAIFTQGISSVSSVSRLMYVMGRESILPPRYFAYVHPKWKTPVVNILMVAIVSMLALVIQLDMAVKFVNFGALTAFFFVNISVISHYYARERRRSLKGTLLYLALPAVGAGIIGWLFMLLSKDALIMGLLWLLAGILFHARNTPFAKQLLTRNKMQSSRHG